MQSIGRAWDVYNVSDKFEPDFISDEVRKFARPTEHPDE